MEEGNTHILIHFLIYFQSERHFIMQVVCEATQSSETQVRVAALQCLVKIMTLYYIYMEHYMGPALFAVSKTFSPYHCICISSQVLNEN